jgi:hypothetical protein
MYSLWPTTARSVKNPANLATSYPYRVEGLLFEPGKWAIFDEDNAAMPTNVAFDVLASNPVA